MLARLPVRLGVLWRRAAGPAAEPGSWPDAPAPSRQRLGPLSRFVLGGLVVLALVAVGSVFASRYIGSVEAVRDAEDRATLLAVMTRSLMTSQMVEGFESVAPELDEIVFDQLASGPLVRVKVWDESGTIVYSDDARLVGEAPPFNEEARRALSADATTAHVSTLVPTENRTEAQAGRLLEVYVPLTTPDGERYLFEAYYSYDSVSAESRQIWLLIAPVLLVGLLVLQAVQFPLARSMARRLEENSRERYELLAALEAQGERERIARDLHDDTMQSIYGAGLSLHAAAMDQGVTKEQAVAEAGQNLSAIIAGLRGYMEGLTSENGAPAASSLRDRLRVLTAPTGAGPAWQLEYNGSPVDGEMAQQLYLIVKELVSNANRHSGASAGAVMFHHRDGIVYVTVRDNGLGFDPDVERTGGGLIGVRARIEELGGQLIVESVPGAGSTIRVMVPTQGERPSRIGRKRRSTIAGG